MKPTTGVIHSDCLSNTNIWHLLNEINRILTDKDLTMRAIEGPHAHSQALSVTQTLVGERMPVGYWARLKRLGQVW